MIPVARPRLPRLEAIAPYIARIDEARWYSNFGPLNQQLEERLAARVGLASSCVTTLANATVALELSLRAAGAEPQSLCLLPSWTFSASVHAVLAADLVPCFVDVGEDGLLTPTIAAAALRDAPGRVGAVMPVSVWGQPIDAARWDEFAEETGTSVVIDTAPAFDSVRPSRCLSVVSLHATKVLGVGEGGYVLSSDEGLAADVKQRSNFGFMGSRVAQVAGANGKLSEYAAAIGLAGLDEWPERRAAFQAAARLYRGGLEGVSGVRLPPGWGEDWVSSTCVLGLAGSSAPLASALQAAGVETRAWWSRGMHLQPAFAHCPRLPLPVTERLAENTLGVPFSIDISDAEVEVVCAVVGEVLAG